MHPRQVRCTALPVSCSSSQIPYWSAKRFVNHHCEFRLDNRIPDRSQRLGTASRDHISSSPKYKFMIDFLAIIRDPTSNSQPTNLYFRGQMRRREDNLLDLILDLMPPSLRDRS